MTRRSPLLGTGLALNVSAKSAANRPPTEDSITPLFLLEKIVQGRGIVRIAYVCVLTDRPFTDIAIAALRN